MDKGLTVVSDLLYESVGGKFVYTNGSSGWTVNSTTLLTPIQGSPWRSAHSFWLDGDYALAVLRVPHRVCIIRSFNPT